MYAIYLCNLLALFPNQEDEDVLSPNVNDKRTRTPSSVKRISTLAGKFKVTKS